MSNLSCPFSKIFICLPVRAKEKKRRRRLANPNFKESLSVLVYLASELRACIDVSRMHDGYICRSCATMLDKCSNLHQKISNKLRAALHRLPSSRVAADQSPTSLEHKHSHLNHHIHDLQASQSICVPVSATNFLGFI